MIRKPSVAGSFYPADAELLEEMVSKFISKAEVDKRALLDSKAFVAPHAGYLYSGQVAAYTYAALGAALKKNKFDSLIILGPNHTGYGKPIAVSLDDWQTPLGIVRNDAEFAKALASSFVEISADETAHTHEHSIEVQLPFIQKSAGGVKCVFICMGDQSYDASIMLADAIIAVCGKLGRKVAVLASSDFNHYESASEAKEKDMPAIDALKDIDTRKFNEMLQKSGDTACGFGPITVAALFASKMGAKKGILLKYASSGDITKDYASVVAYASMVFV